MALDLGNTYGPGTDPDTAAYPYGLPRNITVPGDGTGFPLEKAWVKDVYGFLHGLLISAAIVPSGTADTVLASDYRDALEALFLQLNQVDAGSQDTPASFVMRPQGNAFPRAYLSGFQPVWINGTTIELALGAGRTDLDDGDLSSSADLAQKTINVTWAEGVGGGMNSADHPATAGYYHVFVFGKATGMGTEVEWGYDSSITGAGLKADAVVLAADYTPTQTIRRVGRVWYEGGSAIPEFASSTGASRRTVWRQGKLIENVVPPTGSRLAVTMPGVPPNCLFSANVFQNDQNGAETLITEFTQQDSVPSNQAFTLRREDNEDTTNLRGIWRTGPNSEIYVRRSPPVNHGMSFYVDCFYEDDLLY